MSTIHARIHKKRLAANLSMKQLAEAVGLRSWQTVQQWENGKTAPNRGRIEKVASALNTTVGYLQSGSDTPIAEAVHYKHSRKLVQGVCDIAETINDIGLRKLIAHAEDVARLYPAAFKKNTGSKSKAA